jgi:septation ring formation regulator EzrA
VLQEARLLDMKETRTVLSGASASNLELIELHKSRAAVQDRIAAGFDLLVQEIRSFKERMLERHDILAKELDGFSKEMNELDRRVDDLAREIRSLAK